MKGLKRSYARMLQSDLPEASPMNQYSFDRPYPQQFSIPHSTVFYMIKRHKSVDLHVKFMKLCKYTYAKNRIVPVSNIKYFYRKRKPDYWTAFWMTQKRSRANMDLTNANFKIWILCKARIWDYSIPILPDFASKLASKIYQCDANIDIYDQVLTFNDFKVLTNAGVTTWTNNVIKYPDGSIVPFECILENLLHVFSFEYKFSPPENDASLRTPQNIKNMIDVLSRANNQLRSLRLSGLTETFDIALFIPFLSYANLLSLTLIFESELSESFKRKLDNIMDQMFQTPPLLVFGNTIICHF